MAGIINLSGVVDGNSAGAAAAPIVSPPTSPRNGFKFAPGGCCGCEPGGECGCCTGIPLEMEVSNLTLWKPWINYSKYPAPITSTPTWFEFPPNTSGFTHSDVLQLDLWDGSTSTDIFGLWTNGGPPFNYTTLTPANYLSACAVAGEIFSSAVTLSPVTPPVTVANPACSNVSIAAIPHYSYRPSTGLSYGYGGDGGNALRTITMACVSTGSGITGSNCYRNGSSATYSTGTYGSLPSAQSRSWVTKWSITAWFGKATLASQFGAIKSTTDCRLHVIAFAETLFAAVPPNIPGTIAARSAGWWMSDPADPELPCSNGSPYTCNPEFWWAGAVSLNPGGESMLAPYSRIHRAPTWNPVPLTVGVTL
jgi:hypothetical protein